MMMSGNALVVLAKDPVAGQVKTRLLSRLSAVQAAAISAALLQDLLEHLNGLRDCSLFLAYSPAGAQPSMAQLAPPTYELFPQVDGDLGARMYGAFVELFRRGFGSVILIGGDLLPVPLDFFQRGFGYLNDRKNRGVIGPSDDGGYYLLGLSGSHRQLFAGMTWSHTGVFADTIRRMQAAGIDYLKLPEWCDIDIPEDLSKVAAYLQRLPASSTERLRRTLTNLKSDYGDLIRF